MLATHDIVMTAFPWHYARLHCHMTAFPRLWLHVRNHDSISSWLYVYNDIVMTAFPAHHDVVMTAFLAHRYAGIMVIHAHMHFHYMVTRTHHDGISTALWLHYLWLHVHVHMHFHGTK